MMFKQVTLKHKILMLPCFALGALLLLFLVSQFFMERNTALLAHIESSFVPALEVGRDLAQRLTEIQRSMQDAVAAADEERLFKADSLYDEFLQLFERGQKNPFFNAKKLEQLNREFQEYYVLARKTSLHLIEGRSLDEDLIGELETMRERYNSVKAQLQSKTSQAKEDVSTSFAAALRNSRRSAMIMNVIIISCTLLFGGVSFYISRSITSPLSDLVKATDRIAQGDLTQKIVVRSGDEVAVLGNAMERMRVERKHVEEALKQAHEELERRVEERTSQLVEINKQMKREIEERKRAEKSLKSAQAQLIQSGKLASIGELAAGIAHELNQPLMVIRTTGQFIRRSLDKGTVGVDALKEHFEPIDRNTRRMMNIINHLRAFSRQSQGEFSPLNVNRLIEESFLMIGEQLRLHNIEVQKNLTPNPPKVLGNVNQLEQVVLNLLTNARDAIEAKGGKEPGQIEIVSRVFSDDNPWVEILIKDSGDGISEDTLKNIFDPFFTTKEVGKGTGLGLSISYGIIQEHQGEIEVVESSPAGTTFRMKLPVAIEN